MTNKKEQWDEEFAKIGDRIESGHGWTEMRDFIRTLIQQARVEDGIELLGKLYQQAMIAGEPVTAMYCATEQDRLIKELEKKL